MSPKLDNTLLLYPFMISCIISMCITGCDVGKMCQRQLSEAEDSLLLSYKNLSQKGSDVRNRLNINGLTQNRRMGH